jgi:Hydrazine synthase alpha subunit middle domain
MEHKMLMRRFVLRSARRVLPSARLFLLAGLLGSALLAGCSSGGSVAIANSQPPDSQTTDFGIVYVKRTVPPSPLPATQDDLRLRRTFLPQANLYLLNPTSAGGTEANITARVTAKAPTGTFYDLKDVDVSSDGTRVIFAMRGPLTPNQKDLNPPNWNIWEYVVATDDLHTLLPTSDPLGTGSQYISPHYLSDGRILFATTRQIGEGAVLLNEGKPEFEGQTEDLDESAFVLHVMNPDGSGLHQITYNPSHDVDATLLNNGRVMWSRWDHANGNSGIHLYTSNPDGTDVELLYGRGSHDTLSTNPGGANTCPAGQDCTVQFVRSREMPNGKVLALVRPFNEAAFGGNLEIIDVNDYVENNQAYPDTVNNLGYSTTAFAEQAATQNAVLTAINTTTNLPVISPGGRFSSAFPLWDGTGRILVTWSECRLQNLTGTILPCTPTNLADVTLTAAPVLYSAWMFDPAADTFKPIVTPTEGVFITDIVALQPRPAPPAFIADSYTVTTTPVGVIDIRSVYDWDGAPWSGTGAGGIAAMAQTEADQRPARFLRLVKAVGIPDKQTLNFDQATAFGAAGNYMREILGYVPIEPDGSVRVTVPANVAVQVSVLDANAREIFPLHRAWLQLLPGEVLSCNGCHLPPAEQTPVAGGSFYSHGRPGTFVSAWSGATSTGPFPGTQGSYTTCINADGSGETMAEALVGYNCGNSANSASAAATPSVNVIFTDPWFGGGVGNEPVLLSYDDPTFTTPLPTSQSCALPGGWTANCRIIINYPTNIQPLWDKDRGANTCVNCHTASTAATGYLDLADGASPTDANQDNAYQQLLQSFSVTTTNPTTGKAVQSVVRTPEFISGDALDSHFFQVFATDATHIGLLSPAEMRLLSEWVDIGAQYYNNPFDAPTN